VFLEADAAAVAVHTLLSFYLDAVCVCVSVALSLCALDFWEKVIVGSRSARLPKYKKRM
jgi:hypothetical protein